MTPSTSGAEGVILKVPTQSAWERPAPFLLLASMQVRCDPIASALIPTAPGDKIKTDRRDCRRLAWLDRAGELTVIRVPTVAEEAVRDLCRARADMLAGRSRPGPSSPGRVPAAPRPQLARRLHWTLAHER